MNEIARDWHEEDLRRIRGFRLLDDDFMAKVLEDNIECTQLILHIVLNKPELQVTEVHAQHSIKNLQGHSVRLDVYATDAEGKKYNIEIQRADIGAGVRRARYNSSLMDANSLQAGENYDKLPETYVIFITEHDVLGYGLPLYTVERTIQENGKPFRDGAHIIYVNAEYRDDSPLGKLMQDFACTDPSEMYYPVLKERTRYFKEEQEGVAHMCKAIEDMRIEVAKEVARKTERDAAILHLKAIMNGFKVSAEQAMDVLGIAPESREEILRDLY